MRLRLLARSLEGCGGRHYSRRTQVTAVIFCGCAYLINQTLRHKFFTEPSNYSLLLAQEFAGVYFRVSTILGQHFMAKCLRTSSNCFAGTGNLESDYRLQFEYYPIYISRPFEVR